MESLKSGSWTRIKKYKAYVKYSNLLLVPWFFLGLFLSSKESFLAVWILAFVVIFKLPLFFLVKKLQCPVCGKPFVSGGMSLAFAKACGNCHSKIDEKVVDPG
ncbi:hypothetical protein BH10BDE1_BH10BDE1_23780 [soil metagenome]